MDAGHARRPRRARPRRPAPTPGSACTRRCGRGRAPSRDVELVARRLAAGLRARGVGPGDVVALQLPNWMEAAAAFWASAFLGAVVVPIVHFYGRKELGHILDDGQAARLRHRRAVRPDGVPARPVRGRADRRCRRWWDGRDFDDLLADEPMAGTVAADPPGPALIAFTSGTTRDPKGVIHSHQTLGFETRQLLANYPPDRGRQLTAHPGRALHRHAGRVPDPGTGGRADRPLPTSGIRAQVLALMKPTGSSIGGGPPYFVTSLLDHPDCTAGAPARTSRPSASAGPPSPPR